MWAIINLVWFLFLAFLVLRVCCMLMKNQVVARKPKARVVYPYVAPKRPSAFDPANKSTLHLTEEDKRWFNHIARLCESVEPYPFSESRSVCTWPTKPPEYGSYDTVVTSDGTFYVPT